MSKVGDMIDLSTQTVEVVECEKCNALMVKVKHEDVTPEDLVTLKNAGVRLTNPETTDPVCLNCEIDREDHEHTFKRKVRNYFDDDSSSLFKPSTSIFGGGFGFGGGGGGGFGGFGGGSFSGGGASGGF